MYNSIKVLGLMMVELIVLGVGVGVISGFLGIGGGAILIPMLLFLGYATKEAIGISVIQMVFSSIYGSYLNSKKGTLDIPMVSIICIGGFIGAFFSGFITSGFNDKTLEIIFLTFIVFAIVKMFFKTKKSTKPQDTNRVVLFLIGLVIGAISMTIGVGGGLLLIPILIGFLDVSPKKATSAGLFFVIFSSVSGMISHSISSDINFESGIIIGLASLIGVYIGINLKDKVDNVFQKKLLVSFYMLIVSYLIYRIFINV